MYISTEDPGLAGAPFYHNAAILTLVNVVISIVRLKKISFSMYAGITTASFLFMLLYAAPFLGLPEIIAGARLACRNRFCFLP